MLIPFAWHWRIQDETTGKQLRHNVETTRKHAFAFAFFDQQLADVDLFSVNMKYYWPEWDMMTFRSSCSTRVNDISTFRLQPDRRMFKSNKNYHLRTQLPVITELVIIASMYEIILQTWMRTYGSVRQITQSKTCTNGWPEAVNSVPSVTLGLANQVTQLMKTVSLCWALMVDCGMTHPVIGLECHSALM